MLRHSSIIVLSTLAIMQQYASSNPLVCNNVRGTVNLFDDDGICRCTIEPTYKFAKGYKYRPGIGVHKFHSNAKNWTEARKTCIQEGAHLAILSSPEEGKILQRVFEREYNKIQGSPYRTDHAWLGVHDMFHENDWVTVLGDPLLSTDYVGWNNEETYGIQPDNTNNQDCASIIRQTGTMDDVQCSWNLAYFCEKPNTC